ncbi:MAG: MoaD/ThiS family protein [Acidimicrobiales bacterium]
MAVVVRIPAQLRSLTGGEGELSFADHDDVGQVLEELMAQFPELGSRIFDESGEVRRFVNIFVADEDIRFSGGLRCAIKPGQTVSIVPAVAGG